MPQLLSLPVELLRDICLRLVGHFKSSDPSRWDPESLSHLCQTSKSIHHIGTSILYACYDGNKRRPSRGGRTEFLRTISLRPELGELVQELRLWDAPSHGLDDFEKDVFKKAAARLGVDISGLLEHSPFRTMASLVIAQTPNLRALEVYVYDLPSSPGGSSPFNIFEDASPAVSLPQLRQLCLGQNVRAVSLQFYRDILQFATNLTDLTLESTFTPPPTGAPGNGLMRFGNVTRLAVQGSCWSRSGLQFVVSQCRALEEFRYCSTEFEDDVTSPTIHPRELIEALRQYGHNNTLRVLEMDMELRECHLGEIDSPVRYSVDEQIPSLKDFSQLASFYVTGTLIHFPAKGSPEYRTDVLINMLPNCIRCFRIFCAPEESVANVLSLAKLMANFPFIKEVYLGVDDGRWGWDISDDGPEMKSLMDLFTTKGVQFGHNFGTLAFD